ncbi:MAG: DUF302 domain-containing protein [Polyangiaceae bacterium]|nr:DUF302 domain-containing protein [Polyangiaceae bacterium]
MNINVPYGITARISKTTLGAAREKVTAALSAEGFGVLTEIDVAATLQKKIGATIDPYVILGACNPKLAHRAITSEPGIGLLLPCNVVLTQDGDDVVVSAASPKAMFTIAEGKPEMASVAAEAEEKLSRAVAAVAG